MMRFLVVAVCVLGASVAGATDFVTAVPVDGAPPHTQAICSRLNARREQLIEDRRPVEQSLRARLEAEKKAPVYANPPRGIGSTNIAWFRTKKDKDVKIKERSERLEFETNLIGTAEKDCLFADLFGPDIKLNDVGIANREITVDTVISATQALVELPVVECHVIHIDNALDFLIKRKTNMVVLNTDTSAFADGSTFETVETLWVSKTQRFGGSTYFVLEPIRLGAIIQAKR